MKRVKLPRMALLNRIIWFLVAFGATLLMQVAVGNYQTNYVLAPMEERTDGIQSISSFLNEVEGCMKELKDHRWDYGDAEELIATLRDRQQTSAASLEEVSCEIGEVSEEQYLLASAVKTTYGTFSTTLDQIIQRLEDGEDDKAADLYYSKAEPCGGYMRQYTQQLLERALQDNQSAYYQLTRLNDRLNRIQGIIMFFCFLFGMALVSALYELFIAVRDMARASQDISRGILDTPDVDESLQDEIGQMAKAFNEMKRSMKQRVELLNEKNEMERELHEKEKEALKLQNLMEREKLQQLRSQINPHFLFNTLNVILYTSRQEGAVQTQALIGSLSRLFRYALGSNDAQVPLSREVHIVDEFYSLYHARFQERIQMEWHFSPEVDLTETLVPSFVLQPIVENAFRHGLSPKEEGGRVDIYVREEEGLLKIDVTDNGVGMAPETLERLKDNLKKPSATGEHIGINNVAARLKLLGGAYGLDIHSRQGEGTTVMLRLPLLLETLEEEEEKPDDQDPDYR